MTGAMAGKRSFLNGKKARVRAALEGKVPRSTTRPKSVLDKIALKNVCPDLDTKADPVAAAKRGGRGRFYEDDPSSAVFRGPWPEVKLTLTQDDIYGQRGTAGGVRAGGSLEREDYE